MHETKNYERIRLMLKDISKIKIQGANLYSATTFPLFSNNGDAVNVCLLYGRNGSGKSTIAHGFNVVKGIASMNVSSAIVLDDTEAEVVLTSEEKTKIHVFDENYVNEKVYLKEDGLGSIIMLGDKAKLTEDIEKATKEFEEAKLSKEQKEIEFNEYNDIRNDKSPGYYLEEIKKVLKKEDGWAGRKRVIENKKTNASVSDTTYREFIGLSPSKSRDELIVDYSHYLERLEKAQGGDAQITNSVPSIDTIYKKFEALDGNKLLTQVIQRPVLNEREKYLIKLVEEGHSEEIKETAQEYINLKPAICPKCFQELSDSYRLDLVESIQKVLSKDVEEHQRALRSKELPQVLIDLTPFKDLISHQICSDLIDSINSMIDNNNTLLKCKYDNPYTPITDELSDISKDLTALEDALEQLENERIAYNTLVTNKEPIKVELNRINNEIAYWDVIGLANQYNLKKLEKDHAYAAFQAAKKEFEEKGTILNSLRAKLDDIDIAIDVINDSLKYIFFSETRMKISVDGKEYKLLCNGNPVRAKDVSVGERNIIGLCYFFASILEGKKRETAYDEEYLLVIDDPVSSFDLENRIGILSYLKYEFSQVLMGNTDSKILIMSHDLFTAMDIEKINEELKNECKSKYSGHKKLTCVSKELRNHLLEPFTNKRNEYTELMKLVYEYANNVIPAQEAYIGNIIRQVLEAFATFEFKKGIDQISTDDSILSLLKSEDQRKYYKNLMYRLVINGGSHRKDQVRNMDLDFFALISESEKQRTAKDVLCFMTLLNKPHIEAHLGKDAILVIDQWCQNLITPAE